MAFTDIDFKRCENVMNQYIDKNRPPTHIRAKLDLSYRITGQSIEIFEIRPGIFNKQEVMEQPVAKATYIKSKQEWRVYWMRADLKWHRYEPCPTVHSLEDFLSLITEDEYCCFWG